MAGVGLDTEEQVVVVVVILIQVLIEGIIGTGTKKHIFDKNNIYNEQICRDIQADQS